jgi:hypothetical protein
MPQPKINLKNFAAVQQEAIANFQLGNTGPADPTSLADLKAKLANARNLLPPVYRVSLYDPFTTWLNQLTPQDYTDITGNDNAKMFVFDFAQSIIQHATHFQRDATSAFQEVVSDLYDGFLSAEDRQHIKMPDFEVIAPIVKWGNPEDGPYTITIEQAQQIKVQNAVVSLPPAIAQGVLVAWSSLAHETAGHDIAHADDGLVPEMQAAVANAIRKDTKIKSAAMKNLLATYWSNCMDETSADVMGILNMGPAPAIGMIPFFRSFLHQFGRPAKLRNTGPGDDPHPADILRVMLGASAVRGLSFAGAWADAILAEGLKDLTTIKLGTTGAPVTVDKASAQRSADIAASTLMNFKFNALGGHALKEIQDWKDADEQVVASIRGVFNGTATASASVMQGAYAAHVVAAAVYESMLVVQPIAPLFTKMIAMLKQMHDTNAGWGPMFVLQPGNMKRDVMIQLDEATLNPPVAKSVKKKAAGKK